GRERSTRSGTTAAVANADRRAAGAAAPRPGAGRSGKVGPRPLVGASALPLPIRPGDAAAIGSTGRSHRTSRVISSSALASPLAGSHVTGRMVTARSRSPAAAMSRGAPADRGRAAGAPPAYARSESAAAILAGRIDERISGSVRTCGNGTGLRTPSERDVPSVAETVAATPQGTRRNTV